LALPLALDHAVIAVRDLDAAAATFRALGFTLTPRGQHSIGSQNHCIMFGSTYIELLASPKPHPWLDYYRGFGEGLAAIALSTNDADAASREFAAKPPMDLSRPVEGGIARFRLVPLDGVPYLFVCQHLTPELVWRPEWQSHANGGQELIGVGLPMQQPTDGLPASIAWGKPPVLRIRGDGTSTEAHGVRLAFS
jgi:hypothetical protein